MFCLPILWPFDSKTAELRRLSELFPGNIANLLKSINEYLLCDFPISSLAELVGPSNSNHGMKVVECAVVKNYGHSAQLTTDFLEVPISDMPRGKSFVLSALHDIGVPTSCTDIVCLLIDDLLTRPSEKKLNRYYRAWSSSGAAMLVSSTTVRSFDSAGYLAEVRKPCSFLNEDSSKAFHIIRMTVC